MKLLFPACKGSGYPAGAGPLDDDCDCDCDWGLGRLSRLGRAAESACCCERGERRGTWV